MKCFISRCCNTTILNYTEFRNNDNIQEVIKGLKNFEEIENIYNNKFLLNGCDATMNEDENTKKYEICMNDGNINSANNTNNIIKLVEYMVDNIYRTDQMNKDIMEASIYGQNYTYFTELLFNDSNFQTIENIFYKYIFSVDDIFKHTIINNLNEYLKLKKNLLVILVFSLSLIMVLYNVGFLCISVPNLVYLLNVSRCVLKIIPTSVIIHSPDLESWIENKY